MIVHPAAVQPWRIDILRLHFPNRSFNASGDMGIAWANPNDHHAVFPIDFHQGIGRGENEFDGGGGGYAGWEVHTNIHACSDLLSDWTRDEDDTHHPDYPVFQLNFYLVNADGDYLEWQDEEMTIPAPYLTADMGGITHYHALTGPATLFPPHFVNGIKGEVVVVGDWTHLDIEIPEPMLWVFCPIFD